MLRFALIGALALCCTAAEPGFLQVDATLETGSQAGHKIPLTLAYDSAAVAKDGESVVAARPLGAGLTPLQRAEAVFQNGVLKSVRIFLRLEGVESPIHNLVIGVAGPQMVTYVDQSGHIGAGSYRLSTVANSSELSVIRPLPEPLELHPHQIAEPNSPNPGLVIFAPQAAGANPLNLVHPSAAPNLLIVDPAPLTLAPPPPLPPL